MNSLTSAVAAVIADPAGRLLLCQQSQGQRLWSLPGGKIQIDESPLHAAVRDIRAEVGADVSLVELIGLYKLTDGPGLDSSLGEVLIHVFRARIDGEVTVNAPGLISRLCWHEPADLPGPMTATACAAIDDAVAGRTGVIRTVHRAAAPEFPDAIEPALAASN
ncbi:MAG TPA: NUDIX hydrolase [Micromonosporaceae bacterium]|jgi:ADP-ribose pyrophosphatase YjhB (NUDIX family)